MTGKPQTFDSFEEFAISAEMQGVTPGELAKKVGAKVGNLRVVLTRDGKFRFFGERGAVPCPEGFEITDEIGDYVRELGVTNLTIPDSVTSIGMKAFSDCTSLTSVSIPNSVTSIGSNAFFNCTSLSNVSIPNSVTNIGYNAFFHCISLKSISIPNSVTSIGSYAFSGCDNLMKVVFEGNTKSEIETMKYYPWGVEDMSVVKVAVDRNMATCRRHESFCMDDDCRNPRHPMSVPCDSDAPLSEICGKCGDFETKFEK